MFPECALGSERGLLEPKVWCDPEGFVSDPPWAFPATPDLILAVVAASSNVPEVPEVPEVEVGSTTPRPWEANGCGFTALSCPAPKTPLSCP